MKSNNPNNIVNDLEDYVEMNPLYSNDQYSCWPHIKNNLFIFLSSNGAVGVEVKRVFTLKSLFFLIRSIFLFIFFILKKRNKILYFGALSTIRKSDQSIYYDSHSPKNFLQVEDNDFLNFVNVGDASILANVDDYLIREQVASDNGLVFLYKILAKPVYFFLLSKKIKGDSTRLHNYLKENHKIDIKEKEFHKWILNYFITKGFYQKVFKLLCPVSIYLVSSYSRSPLIAAAKSHNIDVYEVQHGYVGRSHRGYNYACKSLKMPLPDKIYVYNEFWLENLKYSGFDYFSKIEVIGHVKFPFLIYSEILPSYSYVLFSGQGVGYESIKRLAIELEEVCKETGTVFVYKPHPREDSDSVRFHLLGCSDLIEIYSGSCPTEQLIAGSKAHISIYSTCHFDAVNFKGETFILEDDFGFVMEEYTKRSPERFVVLNAKGLVRIKNVISDKT